MSNPLLDVLTGQPELLGQLGRRLLEIGGEMLAGRVDDKLASLLGASEYPAWQELDQAIAVIQHEARHEQLMPELEEALRALLMAIASGLAVELAALVAAKVTGTSE